MADDYDALEGRVFDLYVEGRFEEALGVADEVRARYPEKADRALYWTACLRCVSGDPEGGLRALQEGLRAGFWFVPDWLRSEDDLAALRVRPEFESVIEESERRWRVAQGASRMELLVFQPTGRLQGVLIALHGGDGRADETAAKWEAATELGMLLAVPQSSQRVGMNGFGWSDRAITERDLAEVYARLSSAHDFNGARVVLGGFSQGAGVALTLAIDGTGFPVHGFVAVGPGFLGIGHPRRDAAEAAGRGVRGFILLGERDRFRADAEAAHREIAAKGVACDLVVEPGVGHVIPPGFGDRLLQGLDFVLPE